MEHTIIKAIKNDIAIYAIHTPILDIISGVNGMIASKLGLKKPRLPSFLPKEPVPEIIFYVPAGHAAKVMDALFEVGGGNIGNYSMM